MTTKYQVASYARSLVGQKVTVPTNPYGGQCVALIDHIMQHFTGGKLNMAYTNAKDCLDRAKAKGLEVIYYNGSNVPDVGDFFVCQWGPSDLFGHIGVCITADPNMIVSVEQNIDGYRDENANGINDQLEIGGGGYTRHHSRNYNGVIGWFRLPYNEPEQANKVEKEVKEMIDTAYAIRLEEDLGKRKAGEIYIVNVGARTFKLQNADTWNTIKDVFPEIKVLKATKAVNYLHASIQAWGLTEDK
ncbi:CHAP domain-containing protein [Streptococcus suis]|nr:CHAP domain-containing protein [Streptococcus suis]